MRPSPTRNLLLIASFALFISPTSALPVPSGGCEANAGTISIEFNAGCLVNGEGTVSATPDGNAVVPAGFNLLYVLTQTNGLIIQAVNTAPTFTVNSLDIYRIHTLVYDPATLDLSTIQFGETSAYDIFPLLIAGGGSICASLDVSGAPFKLQECEDVCTADAGTISADQPDQCLVNGSATLTATGNDISTVPPGYTVLYVLTQGPDLLIEQVSTTASFTVTASGQYTIHTLVYDPTTLDLSTVVFGESTGGEVNGLLIQGGGTICASLDVTGAEFQVADCTPPCIVDAGTITATTNSACVEDGGTLITAVPDLNAVIPFGYEVLYVLTSGLGQTIVGSSSTPSFTVSEVGLYTIHTLIFEPGTFDLALIEPGASGFEVENALIEGGGSICAGWDLFGATTWVELATAGSLSADQSDLCLVDGSATLTASVVEPASFGGFPIIYILSSGPDLVLLETNDTPTFTVTATGPYTIHTLAYDPATLDLSTIVLGETTGADVNALLVQGGGTICAALDVVGAEFQVADCTPVCTAFAGTLTPDQTEAICLVDGIAHLSATPNGDAVVPAGYVVSYVLTRGPGLFIQNIEPDAAFEWPLTGEYTIHTLVYDPTTLDLSFVQFDVTTGFDIKALLIQGGGTICASLDVAGAQFTIIDCTPPCTSDAGIGGDHLICFNQGSVDLFSLLTGTPDAGGSWTGPTGMDFSGTFDPTTDLTGVYVYAVQDGLNCPTDTTQLVIDVIECPGVSDATPEKWTPGENAGTATTVVDPTTHGVLSLWPNPAVELVNVTFAFVPSQRARIELIDELGRSAAIPVSILGNTIQLDVRSLAMGAWMLRIVDGDHHAVARFVHAQR